MPGEFISDASSWIFMIQVWGCLGFLRSEAKQLVSGQKSSLFSLKSSIKVNAADAEIRKISLKALLCPSNSTISTR